MIKSSAETIKMDEIKVLDVLEQHAKESVNEIVKRCGFARQKVWKIIKHLEENKIIWGYTAIFDTEIQGDQKFILSIKRSGKILDKQSMSQVANDRLEKIILDLGITIESSYYLIGEYDWILIIRAKDLMQAKKFTEILLTAYPGIVDKVNLSQILFIQRDHRVENPDKAKLKQFL
jgi:DNA-binding Lrp family transcriptional regulator